MVRFFICSRHAEKANRRSRKAEDFDGAAEPPSVGHRVGVCRYFGRVDRIRPESNVLGRYPLIVSRLGNDPYLCDWLCDVPTALGETGAMPEVIHRASRHVVSRIRFTHHVLLSLWILKHRALCVRVLDNRWRYRGRWCNLVYHWTNTDTDTIAKMVRLNYMQRAMVTVCFKVIGRYETVKDYPVL